VIVVIKEINEKCESSTSNSWLLSSSFSCSITFSNYCADGRFFIEIVLGHLGIENDRSQFREDIIMMKVSNDHSKYEARKRKVNPLKAYWIEYHFFSDECLRLSEILLKATCSKCTPLFDDKTMVSEISFRFYWKTNPLISIANLIANFLYFWKYH